MARIFIGVSVACGRLGISVPTFYRLVKSDPRFPQIIKIGGRSVVDDEALTAYQDALIALATSETAQ